MNKLVPCRALFRQFSSSARAQSAPKRELHPKYIAIREKYAKFQVNDGVPIHLKGGTTDRILYGSTLLVTGAGVVMMLEFFYSMMYK